MYCIVRSITYFFHSYIQKNVNDVLVSRIYMLVSGCHVPPPSVETTGWFPWILSKPIINRSWTTKIFLFGYLTQNSRGLFSIPTHNQKSSESILINVSSIIYSKTFFSLTKLFEDGTYDSNENFQYLEEMRRESYQE